MERLKLKSYVLPTLTTMFVFGLFITTLFMRSTDIANYPANYVSDIILGNRIPVINTTDIMINPYTAMDIELAKGFYDYNASEEEQTKSIVKYDDTYIQNTGVDFTSKQSFDVVSVLEGEIISVTDDETLGKVVKIQHDNGYVSVYQSLSETNVNKGDKVIQGQVIGKSGSNKLDEDLGNHLHFELYVNNQMVDPTQYLNKSLNVSN